jgi:cysteine synthase A
MFDDNSLTIGNTPLVRLNRLAQGLGATVAVKVEGRNPAYSVKCRTAASMVWEAERDGTLKPGMEIVEPTSGNTGIALAMVAAARGYMVTLTMPESMSLERRRVLAALGANLVLTPAAAGMAGAVQRAKELMLETPGRFFMPDQFSNPANPLIHEGQPARKSGRRPTDRSRPWWPALGRAVRSSVAAGPSNISGPRSRWWQSSLLKARF